LTDVPNAFVLENFVTILLLTFAVFLVITGAFTAYFGSGKSRKIGGGLLAGGVVIGLLWVWLVGISNTLFDVKVLAVVVQAVGVILAAAIGAGLAIGLFLLAIMKS
jgi:hypothetical protein